MNEELNGFYDPVEKVFFFFYPNLSWKQVVQD